MTDKCTFGIKKPCTTEQFEDEVSDFYSKCTLKDVGEFYFCYGEPTKADEKKFYVHLKFHDKDESVLHTSTSSPFNIGKGTYPITSIAIDKGTPGDFKLVSNEGEAIEVHAVVLAPLWPFLEAAVTSDMKEANDKSLNLQCSTSTLEVIVRFFYEQDLKLAFVQAADLIVVAQMYGLSELLEIAITKIKAQKMDVQECLTAWERCQEAKNEELRKYCASKMKPMMSGLVGSGERLDKMAKEDLLVLFMDVSTLFV